MNESTLTELKVLVERAVRPVRAGVTRKRKMREELLAHLSAAFAQERARVGDAAALARAAERFGDPGALTGELQASVPWLDLAAWLVAPPLWLRRPGESRWCFAVRQSLELAFFSSWTGIAGSLLVLGLASLVTLDGSRPILQLRELPLLFAGMCIGLLGWVVISSAAIFLTHGMIHALYGRPGRSWPLVLLLGGAASLLGVSLPSLLFVFDQLGPHADAPGLLASLPCGAAVGPGLLLCVASVCRRMTDGPVTRPWRPIARAYAGGCLAVAGVTFAAAVVLSGDALLGLENTLRTIVILASWVVPLELALRSPTIVGRLRSDQEWANLPIHPKNAAPA